MEIDPRTQRRRLFNLNVSQRKGGTGLGCTEAWYAIRDAGGTIEVESEVGKGTTFIIQLPIAQGGQSTEGRVIASPSEARGKQSQGGFAAVEILLLFAVLTALGAAFAPFLAAGLCANSDEDSPRLINKPSLNSEGKYIWGENVTAQTLVDIVKQNGFGESETDEQHYDIQHATYRFIARMIRDTFEKRCPKISENTAKIADGHIKWIFSGIMTDNDLKNEIGEDPDALLDKISAAYKEPEKVDFVALSELMAIGWQIYIVLAEATVKKYGAAHCEFTGIWQTSGWLTNFRDHIDITRRSKKIISPQVIDILNKFMVQFKVYFDEFYKKPKLSQADEGSLSPTQEQTAADGREANQRTISRQITAKNRIHARPCIRISMFARNIKTKLAIEIYIAYLNIQDGSPAVDRFGLNRLGIAPYDRLEIEVTGGYSEAFLNKIMDLMVDFFDDSQVLEGKVGANKYYQKVESLAQAIPKPDVSSGSSPAQNSSSPADKLRFPSPALQKIWDGEVLPTWGKNFAAREYMEMLSVHERSPNYPNFANRFDAVVGEAIMNLDREKRPLLWKSVEEKIKINKMFFVGSSNTPWAVCDDLLSTDLSDKSEGGKIYREADRLVQEEMTQKGTSDILELALGLIDCAIGGARLETIRYCEKNGGDAYPNPFGDPFYYFAELCMKYAQDRLNQIFQKLELAELPRDAGQNNASGTSSSPAPEEDKGGN